MPNLWTVVEMLEKEVEFKSRFALGCRFHGVIEENALNRSFDVLRKRLNTQRRRPKKKGTAAGAGRRKQRWWRRCRSTRRCARSPLRMNASPSSGLAAVPFPAFTGGVEEGRPAR